MVSRRQDISDSFRRLLSADLLAFVVIVGISMQAPAFQAEDVLFFNYVNNAHDPHMLYIYNGYVPLIPEAVAYILQFLPLSLQAVLYRIIALGVVLLIYREAKLLFALYCPGIQAAFLSLAIIFFIRFVDYSALTVLSYTVWTAFLAAGIYMMRKSASGAPYSIPAIAGIIVAGLSNPIGILLAPLFLTHVTWSMKVNWNNNLAYVGASIVIVVGDIAMLVRSGAGGALSHVAQSSHSALHYLEGTRRTELSITPPDVAFSQVVFWFHNDFKLQVLMIVVSVAVLGVGFVLACWRWFRIGASMGVKLNWMLAYLGVATFALYLASPRFLINVHAGMAFSARYELVLTVCAMLAVSLGVIRLRDQDLRPILAGSVFGFCAALVVIAVYPSVTGHLKVAIDKYRFLTAAAGFRQNCGSEQAFVYDPTSFWSPVVLCRRRNFPPGFSPVEQFKTWRGSLGQKGPSPDDRPGIWSGRSLF